MEQEHEIVVSPLSQSVADKGHTVRFDIYRGADSGWTLEAIDSHNNSTVWDAQFATEQAALDEGLRAVHEEGIESLIGTPGSGSDAAA